MPTQTYDRDVRGDLAELRNALDGRDNFKKAMPHTSRHGLEGYNLHFGGRYLFGRTVEKIRELGFEIDAVALSSHVDKVNFRVRVVPRNTEIKDLAD